MVNKTQAVERLAIFDAITTITGSAGRYTVPDLVAVEVASALKAYSCVRQVATVINTPTGAPMVWPNSDGTSEVGELLNESAYSATTSEIVFGGAVLNVFRFGSKVIAVPIELMQDSAADPLGFLLKRIAARLGRITNRKFTIGTGIGEPLGIINAAGIGKYSPPGQTVTVTQDDLADLITSVDEVHRQSPNCVFMMSNNTLQFIRRLTDSTGQPLNMVSVGQDGKERLLGYRVVTNPDMPQLGAGKTPIAFGDFATFVVRDVTMEKVVRMTDSAPTLKGQEWFLGVARSGGAYTDAGGAIMLFKNAAV